MICSKVWCRDVLFVVLLSICYANAVANILPVPIKYTETGKNYWCWAAASQAVLEYYGYYNSQSEIAAYGTNGVDTYNYLFFSDANHQAIDRILKKFSYGYLNPIGINNILDKYTLIRSLDYYRSPIAISWWLSTNGIGHTVVIKGVDLDYATFIVMDPARGELSGSYNWLVDGDGHEWVESLTIGMGKEYLEKTVAPGELDVLNKKDEELKKIGLSGTPDWDGASR